MLIGRSHVHFSGKVHSKEAKLATAIGVVAWLIFIVLAVQSITSKGNVGIWLGTLGVADAFCTMVGLGIGLVSFRGEDVLPFYPALASIVNGLLLVVFVILFLIGVL